MTQILPAIFGCETTALTEQEIALFREYRPLGYILFARNCHNPEQVSTLVASLKGLHQEYQPLILIDQEGGRVARLRAPHWWHPPAPKFFADMAAENIGKAEQAVYENSVTIAKQLSVHGINVNCVPMADTLFSFSHDIIGDRAYGNSAAQIIALARKAAQGLLDNGVLPVLKHLPGHGRALADSHETLPVVNASLHELIDTDFVPFKALADLPLGMTAHITYTAIDKDYPATLSAKVIRVIREEIGFIHPLMSDDLCMKALGGEMGDLAKASLDAGCDIVLHCNGDFAEISAIVKAIAGYSFAEEKLQHIYSSLTL